MGSTAEVSEMREQMRAITRSTGLPHFFITINLADYHNPVHQFLLTEIFIWINSITN